MANEFVITLPEINGSYEAGIAAGTDSSLPEAAKLQVNTAASPDDAATQAAAYAFSEVSKALNVKGNLNKTALAVLAYSAVRLNLVQYDGQIPDGDWVASTQVVPTEPIKHLKSSFTKDAIQQAITLILATKVGMWCMNHHTGQGAIQGYPRKVYTQYQAMFSGGESEATSIIHAAGHWASTLYVLRLAGIPRIRETQPANREWTARITLASDASLRFKSNPAGTAGIEVAYQSLRRMLMSSVGTFCPNVENMAGIAKARNGIMDDPARYHIGAEYLTGLPRMVPDILPEFCLGRLGSYISVFAPASTLYKSPKLSKIEGGVTKSRASDYEDYEQAWQEFCQSYATQSRKSHGRAADLLDKIVEASTTSMGVCVDVGLYQSVFTSYEGILARAKSLQETISGRHMDTTA